MRTPFTPVKRAGLNDRCRLDANRVRRRSAPEGPSAPVPACTSVGHYTLTVKAVRSERSAISTSGDLVQ